MRFRTPELFLGALLAVAIFALGMLFAPSSHPVQTAQNVATQTANQPDKSKQDDGLLGWWTKDASGFFASMQLIVLGFQAVFFWYQLGLIRESLVPAGEAARAAETQATAVINAERPYVFLHIQSSGVKASEGKYEFAPDAKFKFNLVNYGKTPALLQEIHEVYEVVDGYQTAARLIDPSKERGRLVPIGTVAAPNAPYSSTTKLKKHYAGYLPGGTDDTDRKRLCFVGFVRYSDVFGKRYITGFKATFKPGANGWEMRGGKEYNYHREERQEDIPLHPRYPDEIP